jgi:hypothetical protein
VLVKSPKLRPAGSTPATVAKTCPRCGSEHGRSGNYCSRSCANSRVFSDSAKAKKAAAARRQAIEKPFRFTDAQKRTMSDRVKAAFASGSRYISENQRRKVSESTSALNKARGRDKLAENGRKGCASRTASEAAVAAAMAAEGYVVFAPTAVCDRIAVKDGVVYLVEFKKHGQKLRPAQKVVADVLGARYIVREYPQATLPPPVPHPTRAARAAAATRWRR